MELRTIVHTRPPLIYRLKATVRPINTGTPVSLHDDRIKYNTIQFIAVNAYSSSSKQNINYEIAIQRHIKMSVRRKQTFDMRYRLALQF